MSSLLGASLISLILAVFVPERFRYYYSKPGVKYGPSLGEVTFQLHQDEYLPVDILVTLQVKGQHASDIAPKYKVFMEIHVLRREANRNNV